MGKQWERFWDLAAPPRLPNCSTIASQLRPSRSDEGAKGEFLNLKTSPPLPDCSTTAPRDLTALRRSRQRQDLERPFGGVVAEL